MSQYYKHANGVDWVTRYDGEFWWVGQRCGFWSFARHDDEGKILYDMNRPVFKTRAQAIAAIPEYARQIKV